MSKQIIIMISLVIAVGAGAFYGGTIYEKSRLTSQGIIRNKGSFGQGQGSQGGQMGQGSSQGQGQSKNNAGAGGRNNGNFTTGQILSKDDKSITVKTPDGGSKIVYFSDTTQVGKTVSGSASDLMNDQNVIVNGTSNSDGSLTAQNIQIRPAENQQ